MRVQWCQFKWKRRETSREEGFCLMLRRFNLRHEKLSELGECRNQDNFLLSRQAGVAELAGLAEQAGLVEQALVVERLFSRPPIGTILRGALVSPSLAGWVDDLL